MWDPRLHFNPAASWQHWDLHNEHCCQAGTTYKRHYGLIIWRLKTSVFGFIASLFTNFYVFLCYNFKKQHNVFKLKHVSTESSVIFSLNYSCIYITYIRNLCVCQFLVRKLNLKLKLWDYKDNKYMCGMYEVEVKTKSKQTNTLHRPGKKATKTNKWYLHWDTAKEKKRNSGRTLYIAIY